MPLFARALNAEARNVLSLFPAHVINSFTAISDLKLARTFITDAAHGRFLSFRDSDKTISAAFPPTAEITESAGRQIFLSVR